MRHAAPTTATRFVGRGGALTTGTRLYRATPRGAGQLLPPVALSRFTGGPWGGAQTPTTPTGPTRLVNRQCPDALTRRQLWSWDQDGNPIFTVDPGPGRRPFPPPQRLAPWAPAPLTPTQPVGAPRAIVVGPTTGLSVARVLAVTAAAEADAPGLQAVERPRGRGGLLALALLAFGVGR